MSSPADPSDDSSSTADQKQSPPREESPIFKEFRAKLEALETPEEKIAAGLEFMRSTISQEGSPRFREFWEARKLMLPFFKENLASAIRSKLWTEYVELTVEARRLKEILEEQSSFAVEQIDLAIQALEREIADFESLLQAAGDVQFPQSSTLAGKEKVYNHIQRELHLLNTLASRLNGLRKEILKTEMRVRFKTKFFKRLSILGDQIFPKRKELIEKISAEFEKDVDHFVEKHFQGEEVVGAPYFALREEIKSLQSLAKIITLNSGSFNRTRMKLSKCWDIVRSFEKEHKKEILEKRKASSENRELLEKKIKELSGKSEGMSLKEIDQEIDQISQEMRSTDLQREDVRHLRDKLHQIKAPHIAAAEQRVKEQEEKEKAKLREKREKITELKVRVETLIAEAHEMELEKLESAFEETVSQMGELSVSKMEKQQFERSIRPLRNLLAEKKEHSLLNLTAEDKEKLENLRTVLHQKKERRQEIKKQLESYRQMLSSSSLDFEKAMMYRDLIDQEKQILDKTNSGIEEIEEKIAELEE